MRNPVFQEKLMEDIQTASRILSRLNADLPDIRLRVFDTVTSTNDLLRNAAADGAPEYTVYAARSQTAGKGRQGRQFFSPPQTGLYLSILLKPQSAPAAALAVTPMAAVAAAEAIEHCSGQNVQIKWVNDLLLNGKKICGILAESQFSDADTLDYVILGIGINLLPPAQGFPPELQQIAGAVYPAGADAETAFTDCAAALISALIREYRRLPEKHYLSGYRERLCMLGKAVTVCENGIEQQAVALAADDDLRLLVRYPDGTEQWRSTGEIRIRL